LAIRRRLSSVGFFGGFMVVWVLGALAVYSWAGEKMPWLDIHITQPLVFLAAMAIAGLLKRINRELFTSRGGLVALALTCVLAAVLLGGLVAAPPVGGTQLGMQSATLQRLTMWLVAGALFLALMAMARSRGSEPVLVPAATGFLVALLVLSIHTAWGVAYERGDTPQDMLVYVQSSPDVTRTMKQVEDMAARTGAGKDMRILLDGGYTDTVGGQSVSHESIAWPFEWYLRDWKGKSYYSRTLPNPTDAPIILAMTANEDPIRSQLSNYVAVRGRLNWWYPEDYKGLTWSKVWDGLTDSSVRAKLWRYFLYKETLNPLGSRDFDLFIRSDLARGIPLQPVSASAPAAQVTAAGAPPSEAIAQTTQGGITVFGKTASGSSVLVDPKGAALGSDGLLYVVDSTASKVYGFRPDGTVAVQFGKKGNGDGEFNEPWGIAVARTGEIYVADTWNHRVQKFDRNGKLLAKWGSFADTKGQLNDQQGSFWGPRDIAVAPNGNVLVTDTGNKRVEVFDSQGKFLSLFGGDGTAPGNLKEPVGITVDTSGNIYVADTWNQRIQKFDAQQRPVAQFAVPGWDSQSIANKPYLAVDQDGRIYYTEPEKNRFVVLSPKGQQEGAKGVQGADPTSFNLPIGIDVSPQGEVYVVDSRNARAVRYQSWR
ncbi:MAG TPA: 6-bladed beta-propeller, partial [Chloroflexota bacterium]|nr:6-bladed beta-propeller [Chloroflexota bacterium]